MSAKKIEKIISELYRQRSEVSADVRLVLDDAIEGMLALIDVVAHEERRDRRAA